jgi:predicted ATP-dependent endonuclease of OLD family
MKLRNIQLSNYRNFKNYSIDFGTETTIFIGKNGTGKTNLLTAIKQSLSFIFSKKKGELQYDFIASSDQSVESFIATDAKYDYDNEGIGDYRYPVSIEVKAGKSNINWTFFKEHASSGLKDSLYRNANEQFWKEYYFNNKTEKELPVFAFFSDSYPHVTTNIGTKIQAMLDSGNDLPRNTAYYKWNEEKNCTEIWVQYFTMQWKNDKWDNGKGNKEYLNAINEKLTDFSESISEEILVDDIKIKRLELEPRGKDDILIVVFENGNRIPFNQLPQGYKRIFSIVFDITNRAYILNSNCNPSGIVIIDEIELHLHPSIAQAILTGLKTTFPNIQFLVSTHSPVVITNFKQDSKNIIYKLYNKNGDYKNEKVDDLYGIDYNSGLRDWMDAPYRKSDFNNLINSYKYWRSADDEDMVEKLKDKIKMAVGEDSELYKSLD